MKLLAVVAILGVTSAAAGGLQRNYLPPQSGGNGGHNNGQYAAAASHNNEQYSVRAQSQYERNAAIIRQDSDVRPDGYDYTFETENGIRATQEGHEADGIQARGDFSYTGDDGINYNIVYQAGEGGYMPQGAHLPTPPPIPEAILKALEQNARDEAAGINDDGSYAEGKYGSSGHYSEGNAGQYNGQSQYQFQQKGQQQQGYQKSYQSASSNQLPRKTSYNSNSGYQY